MTVKDNEDLDEMMYDTIDTFGDRGYTVDEIRESFETQLANWIAGFETDGPR